MLKPWRPQNSHDRRVPVLLWMMIRQPIGPMGVASKFKGPLKCSQVDMSGERVDCQRRFKVSSVCGRSWSQRKLGNESEMLASMERN